MIKCVEEAETIEEFEMTHENMMNELFNKMNYISDNIQNKMSVSKNIRKIFETFGHSEICVAPGLKNFL